MYKRIIIASTLAFLLVGCGDNDNSSNKKEIVLNEIVVGSTHNDSILDTNNTKPVVKPTDTKNQVVTTKPAIDNKNTIGDAIFKKEEVTILTNDKVLDYEKAKEFTLQANGTDQVTFLIYEVKKGTLTKTRALGSEGSVIILIGIGNDANLTDKQIIYMASLVDTDLVELVKGFFVTKKPLNLYDMDKAEWLTADEIDEKIAKGEFNSNKIGNLNDVVVEKPVEDKKKPSTSDNYIDTEEELAMFIPSSYNEADKKVVRELIWGRSYYGGEHGIRPYHALRKELIYSLRELVKEGIYKETILEADFNNVDRARSLKLEFTTALEYLTSLGEKKRAIALKYPSF